MKKIFLIAIYAIAMGYVESAVVVYLREIYKINNLLTDIPKELDSFTIIELGREISTIIMLLTVGAFAGRNINAKSGYFLAAFGIWDLFYYFWLKIFIGWPTSVLEWDLLFLLPLPWWGPVLCPIMISILMIISGLFLVNKADEEIIKKFTFLNIFIIIAGVFIILYTFMYPSLSVLSKNYNELINVRPTKFNWFLFSLGYICVIISLFRIFVFRSSKSF